MNEEFQTIEKLLEKAEKSVKISDAEKTHVRSRLSQTINTQSSSFIWREVVVVNMVRFGVVPLLIVLLISGGVTVASANTLPGDLLYSVKTVIYEPVQRLTYFGESKKIAYEQILAERRLSEIVELSTQNNLNEDTEVMLLESFDKHQQKAEDRAKKVSVSEQISVQSNLESKLRAHERIFARLDKEGLRERLQNKITIAVKLRTKAESELLSDGDLENVAEKKQEEAVEIIIESQDRLEDLEETRIKLQTEVQISLAEQAIEEGDRSVEAGSFVKAIVQYEKAKRVVIEAEAVFNIQERYAIAQKEVEIEEIVVLEQKTRPPVEELAVAKEITLLEEEIESEINIYEYFEKSLTDKAGVDAVPQTYLRIFPSLISKDFNNVISNGGIYEVIEGELKFIETVDVNDGINKTSIESEGYARLLINIATRLGVELISVENIDTIIDEIKETQVIDEVEIEEDDVDTPNPDAHIDSDNRLEVISEL